MNLKEIIRMDALYYSLNINKNDINENNIKYIEDLNNNISNFNSNYTSKFSINPSTRSEINLVNAEAKSINNTSHISSTNSPVKSKNNNNTNNTNTNKLNLNVINTNKENNNLSINSNITTPVNQNKSLKETKNKSNTKNVNKIEDVSNVQDDYQQDINIYNNQKSPVSNKFSKVSLISNTKKSSLILFNNYNEKYHSPSYGFKVNNNNVNKSIVKYDNITIIDDSLSNKNKTLSNYYNSKMFIYNDYTINDYIAMPVQLELITDKRSFCYFFKDKLLISHNLICLFQKSLVTPLYIRLIELMFNISLQSAFNALFYSDYIINNKVNLSTSEAIALSSLEFIYEFYNEFSKSLSSSISSIVIVFTSKIIIKIPFLYEAEFNLSLITQDVNKIYNG